MKKRILRIKNITIVFVMVALIQQKFKKIESILQMLIQAYNF